VLGCVFANAVAQFRIRVGTWRYGLLPKDTRSPVRWRRVEPTKQIEKRRKAAKAQPIRSSVPLCECVSAEYLCAWIGPVLFGAV